MNRVAVPSNTEAGAGPGSVPRSGSVHVKHEVAVGEGLQQSALGIGQPTVISGRFGPRSKVASVQSAVRPAEVGGPNGQDGGGVRHGLERCINRTVHAFRVKGRERCSDGRYTVETRFTCSPHRPAVIRILREVRSKVDTRHHQLRVDPGDEVVQSAVKGDDHRIARRSVQFKQMHGGGVRVKPPLGHQIFTASKGHRLHEVDSHSRGRMIARRRQHGQRVARLVKRFDQQFKPNGLNAVVVGEQKPSTLGSHVASSGRFVLIVRFLRGLLTSDHHRQQARHEHHATQPGPPPGNT